MKDWIKWVILGCAVGAGAWGVIKGAAYVYDQYIKETVENPEFDQVMESLREEADPVEMKVSWVTE